MAAYDKDKLTRLLERRRAAYITLRDYSDRAREAREHLTRMIGHIRLCADDVAAREVVDPLLRLSVTEAAKLTQRQVEAYEVRRGEVVAGYRTGVSMSQWREYLAVRGKAERLQGEMAKVEQNINQQFTIVPALVDAVKKWGFANPEMEVI